ncbi:hypothetical protein K438DRAFT_1188349 [Mycena galopus ATCC 62051]|nr:hypothetical protein K438DRAFT_1188349 [Mycena galopus ATCC 62051]
MHTTAALPATRAYGTVTPPVTPEKAEKWRASATTLQDLKLTLRGQTLRTPCSASRYHHPPQYTRLPRRVNCIVPRQSRLKPLLRRKNRTGIQKNLPHRSPHPAELKTATMSAQNTPTDNMSPHKSLRAAPGKDTTFGLPSLRTEHDRPSPGANRKTSGSSVPIFPSAQGKSPALAGVTTAGTDIFDAGTDVLSKPRSLVLGEPKGSRLRSGLKCRGKIARSQAASPTPSHHTVDHLDTGHHTMDIESVDNTEGLNPDTPLEEGQILESEDVPMTAPPTPAGPHDDEDNEAMAIDDGTPPPGNVDADAATPNIATPVIGDRAPGTQNAPRHVLDGEVVELGTREHPFIYEDPALADRAACTDMFVFGHSRGNFLASGRARAMTNAVVGLTGVRATDIEGAAGVDPGTAAALAGAARVVGDAVSTAAAFVFPDLKAHAEAPPKFRDDNPHHQRAPAVPLPELAGPEDAGTTTQN